MQFPKGTLAGYRGRVILSQEVLCDLTSPSHCPGQAAMPWWKGTKETSPGAQGHGDPSEHTKGLRAVTDLMARTSRPCSQLVKAEAARVFQNFLSCFSSSLPPGTPPYTCLGSLQSPPNSFPKGLGEILHARAATQADASCFYLRE